MANLQNLPSWEDFYSEYLDLERHVQAQSSNKSQYLLTKSYFSNKDFTRANFRQFLAELRKGSPLKNNIPIKEASLNKYITMGKHIAAYLGLTILNDYKDFTIDEGDREDVRLTKAEMDNLVSCYIQRKDGQALHTRYSAIILTLALCGMRPHELCNLTWSDYFVTYFLIKHTKTHKSRKVPIPDRLNVILDRLERYDHGYIFGGHHGKIKPSTINTELQLRASVLDMQKHVTCYSFRKTFVTLCVLSGGESTFPRIAKIAGHSLETCYKHYNKYNVEELKDTLESVHPMLKKAQTIDTVKRIIIGLLSKLIDTSKFDVEITITPKKLAERKIYLS